MPPRYCAPASARQTGSNANGRCPSIVGYTSRSCQRPPCRDRAGPGGRAGSGQAIAGEIVHRSASPLSHARGQPQPLRATRGPVEVVPGIGLAALSPQVLFQELSVDCKGRHGPFGGRHDRELHVARGVACHV